MKGCKCFEIFSSKPFGTASIGWLENVSKYFKYNFDI